MSDWFVVGGFGTGGDGSRGAGGAGGSGQQGEAAARGAGTAGGGTSGAIGDGSRGAPFHDPWLAFRRAEPGDRIHIAAGTYYVVRANALEGNLRLYAYDRGRRQLASASVKPPALGRWHRLRAVALGDHMQAWLDGALLLDQRDGRFKAGRVGLWTKADSITAFDDLTIRGVTVGGQ